MTHPITGVILAGGQNSRFSGKNKAFLRIGGEKVLDRIFNVFTKLFEEIILVTNDPMQYMRYDCMIVTDVFPVRSSLTGLHTGLFYSSTPYVFISPCDMPFLKQEVIELLVNTLDESVDIVVPETSAGLETLCAIYSKKCLHPIEHQLSLHDFKIQRFFNKARVKIISEKMILEKDPDLISFFNINTPKDAAKAEIFEKQTKNNCNKVRWPERIFFPEFFK